MLSMKIIFGDSREIGQQIHWSSDVDFGILTEVVGEVDLVFAMRLQHPRPGRLQSACKHICLEGQSGVLFASALFTREAGWEEQRH
jgi:hypothetical protein